MKSPTKSLFGGVAIAVTALCLADAANCTASDVAQIPVLPVFQAYMSVCAAVVTAKAIEVDAQPNVLCGDTACLEATTALSAALPDCEENGVKLNAVYESELRACSTIKAMKKNSSIEPSVPLAAVAVSRASTATCAWTVTGSVAITLLVHHI